MQMLLRSTLIPKRLYATINTIDFRSDTVTRPTKEMYDAMMKAPVGDDVFGDDPTVIELENYVAQLCGHEKGLFCASGTMTNQLGLRTHMQALQSALIDHRAHIYAHEAGGVSLHTQAQLDPIVPPESSKHITSQQIFKRIISSNDVHYAPTTVISLENTLLGMVYPFEEIVKIREIAKKHDVKMHLDGARIWNASVSTGIPLSEYGKNFDSLSLCLSKGLGAPVGSVLVGNRKYIEKARHFRKAFGGGWRQAGLLAAAGIYAVNNHWKRMAEDHENAAYLAKELLKKGFELDLPTETNLVWLNSTNIKVNLLDLAKYLHQHNILIGPSNEHRLRIVTHLQVRKPQIDLLLKHLDQFMQQKK